MAFALILAGLILVIIGLVVPAHIALWIGIAAVVVGAVLYFVGFNGAGFTRRR